MRRPVKGAKPRTSQPAVFPAPTSGWVSNQNLATASTSGTLGAFLLRNFFPGTSTAILRRGSLKYATVGGESEEVTSFMKYVNGSIRRFFAATPSNVFDISSVADPDVPPAPVITGMYSGDWSSTMFATTGGTFLVAVNGANHLRIFDGADWWSIDDTQTNRLNYDGGTTAFTVGATITGVTSGATATVKRVVGDATSGHLILGNVTGGPFQDNEAITSSPGAAIVNGAIIPIFNAITGIDTTRLSYVWSYKNRLFFIERDSLDVWYLPIDSITGAAVKFPMGGVFSSGGSGLLYGVSWSLGSSGQGGLSEQCVFVTTEGEFAVYQGGNPSSATDWAKVGLYGLGKPLGKRAFVRVGGDVLAATDIGFVPLSQAVQRTIATLAPASASVAIEPDWVEAVKTQGFAPWNAIVWPENQMVVVAPPTAAGETPSIFVANVRTQAWTQYTGWNVRCLEVFDGRLFFGAPGGKVIEANVSGSDDGEAYTGVCVPLFDSVGSPASPKVPSNSRVVVREANPSQPQVTMLFDYDEALPTAPAPPSLSGVSVWGDAVWGEAIWGDGTGATVRQAWRSVYGSGYAMSPCVMVTSDAIAFLDTELIRTEVTYTVGDVQA